MRFCSFVLGWFLGFFAGLAFAFLFLILVDSLPIWKLGSVPIIGWYGWMKLICLGAMSLSIYTIDWKILASNDAATQTDDPASNDAAVQSTPAEDRSVQTNETPLGVVLRDVINDTLLPGIDRLWDARIDASQTFDAFQWVAGFGPDPVNENDDHGHLPPTVNNNNGHDDDIPQLTNGHSTN